MISAYFGFQAGASRHRAMPRHVVGPTTPPPEVGPVMISPPGLSSLVARVGEPIGYINPVVSAGDAYELFPQFFVEGEGMAEEFGPLYTPREGQEGLHLLIQVVVTTGFGEDLVTQSMALQIQPAIVTARPSAPTAVDANPGGTGQIVVTWDLPAGSLTAVKLYHGATEGNQYPGGSGTVPITLAGNATTYTITGLSAGARYISVAGVNAAGEGWTSAEVSATAT